MNKQELIDTIADETDLAKATVSRVFDAQAKYATLALRQGGEVTLPGLGKLKTKESAARTGRNPHTGEEMLIPSKTGVKFVAAKALKDAVA